jgi:hypothetical protein
VTSENASPIRASNIAGESVQWKLGVAVLLTAVSPVLSGGLFLLTAGRCQTSPPGDTDSTWRFSTYCRGLHSVHLFNFPDAVSGGGLLNAIFLIPAVCAAVGWWYVARGNIRRARHAFTLLGASLIVLLAAALLAASASFPGDG